MNNLSSIEYLKSFISATPANLKSEVAIHFKQTLPRFPDEAIFIYSFKENRMIYADGWEEILGYKDDEINMMTILTSTTPEYIAFAHDINIKAHIFIQSKSKDLEKYSFTIELKKIHKNGMEVPLIVKVSVFSSEGGRVKETIGRVQINKSITLGKVMRYAAYGPDKSEFEEELNKQLFKHYAISEKEKEALSLVAKGFSFKEIAGQFEVSHSAIEKRIIPMYKRFNVRSLSHLISFAYENHILPI